MSIELYSCPSSALARMVLLLAKHLNVPLKVTNLDLFKQEQLKPEFIALNPQHTVPTLVDTELIVTESRAILMYLANRYGKDDSSLYPKDPEKRALVDMRLFFDVSTLYQRFGDVHYPVMFGKAKADPEKLAKIDQALEYVELFLKDGYIAGSELTIADFSLAAILSTIEACGFDMSKYSNSTDYLEKCKRTMEGWHELNQVGADTFGQLYTHSLAASNA